MSVFFSIVGILICFLVACTVACFTLECLFDGFAGWRELREQRVREATIKGIGLELTRRACWFGEDESAMNALMVIGEQLRDSGYFNISIALERWREMQANREPA